MAGFLPREHSIRADVGSPQGGARLRRAAAAVEFGLDEDDRYQVKLAMSEAVTNAIQHGSSSASDPIDIRAAEEAGALVFEVTRHRALPAARTRRGDHARVAAAGSSSCGC